MATITSLGVGSGLDLSSIVSGLMAVEKQPLTALKTKQSTVESRISALGTLKSALASLQTAAGNLIPGTTQTLAEKFSSFAAKSADDTIATATAKSGVAATKYTLTNITLASSEQVRKTETALGIPSGTGSGTLSIKIGSGDSMDVSVNNGSSLTDIAKAINSSKAGVTASVINDGTAKHLVITAKDSGASNTISITGSTGYALATEIPVLHAASDLDLLIRAPQPIAREALLAWQSRVAQLPCRADTQVETPAGAFALNEWLRDGRVLLKTSRGARLTAAPWNREEA